MRKITLLLTGLTTFFASFSYYCFHFYTHVIKYKNTEFVNGLKNNPANALLYFTGLAIETTVILLVIIITVDNFRTHLGVGKQ